MKMWRHLAHYYLNGAVSLHCSDMKEFYANLIYFSSFLQRTTIKRSSWMIFEFKIIQCFTSCQRQFSIVLQNFACTHCNIILRSVKENSNVCFFSWMKISEESLVVCYDIKKCLKPTILCKQLINFNNHAAKYCLALVDIKITNEMLFL